VKEIIVSSCDKHITTTWICKPRTLSFLTHDIKQAIQKKKKQQKKYKDVPTQANYNKFKQSVIKLNSFQENLQESMKKQLQMLPNQIPRSFGGMLSCRDKKDTQ
jgi:hypothetical protein